MDSDSRTLSIILSMTDQMLSLAIEGRWAEVFQADVKRRKLIEAQLPLVDQSNAGNQQSLLVKRILIEDNKLLDIARSEKLRIAKQGADLQSRNTARSEYKNIYNS